jgi:hypothetical protein
MRHRPERVAERPGEAESRLHSLSLQRLERESVERGESARLKEKRRAAAQSWRRREGRRHGNSARQKEKRGRRCGELKEKSKKKRAKG